jgi:hypothetical protein
MFLAKIINEINETSEINKKDFGNLDAGGYSVSEIDWDCCWVVIVVCCRVVIVVKVFVVVIVLRL